MILHLGIYTWQKHPHEEKTKQWSTRHTQNTDHDLKI